MNVSNYSLTFTRVLAIIAAILSILALIHVLVPVPTATAVVLLLLALSLLLPF